MEIIVFLALPPVIVFLVLAPMPQGWPFLAAFCVAAALCWLWYRAPLPPASGPDDWFRGIGRMAAQLGLSAAVCVLPAQLLRWGAGLTKWPYIAALFLSTVITGQLMMSFGEF